MSYLSNNNVSVSVKEHSCLSYWIDANAWNLSLSSDLFSVIDMMFPRLQCCFLILSAANGIGLSKVLGEQAKILGGQKVVKSDKCMGVPQLLGGARARAASQSILLCLQPCTTFLIRVARCPVFNWTVRYFVSLSGIKMIAIPDNA